jgi:ferredoxin
VSAAGQRLRVDPIRCDGFGHCAELVPELIALDEWGYPMLADADVTPSTEADARRAVRLCPRLALSLQSRADRG